MRERTQVLAGPLGVRCPTATGDLVALVTADVLARWGPGDRPGVATAVVAGGLSHQFGAEEELWREGRDRAAVGRAGFLSCVAAAGRAAREHLGSRAAALRVGVDLEEAARAGEDAARAARVAFVRLFEAGVVVEADRVVDACPRCGTVVDGPDVVPAVIDGEALVLQLSVLDGADAVGRLDVRCLAPELLPGAAAVAVGEGHPAAGKAVALPVAGTVVPVVVDPSAAEPALVVPAHDAVALERARRAGLTAPAVVDATGTVRAAGPLDGLARHAARAAARRLLGAEGAVAAAEPAAEPVGRCAACRTVLVPLAGRHWFLALGELAAAAADAVRDGRVLVAPAAAREDLLALAGTAADWCLDRGLWAGEPLPVARCADCGSVDVSVELPSSCRRCMGDVVAEDGVLDTRFVSCLWPLWRAGWPDAGRRAGDPGGTTIVVPADRLADAVAMAALGLRLVGAAPFGEVVVAPAPGEAPPDAADDATALRLALACGGLDLDAGRDAAALLDAVHPGDADVDRLEEAVSAALDAGTPAVAVGLLAAAMDAGVPAGAEARVRALTGPFLGR